MNTSRTISARLPSGMVDTLDSIAVEKKIRKTQIIREAIEMYIGEWADYKIAMTRLKDPSDAILNEADFLQELKDDYGWDV